MLGSSSEPFEVELYDPERLSHLFHHAEHNSPLTIQDKYHIRFFKDYFSENEGLNAKYVVVEKKYINRDYLHDYANYYALCYKDYLKVCTRLHFFTGDFGSKDEFEKSFKSIIVEGTSKNEVFWANNYLGFIVIKPTPYSVIGFTILKHYNFNNTKKPFDIDRIYWGIKEYKIHIFGNEVKLSSLAFQEQDSALAACATIAIWCMLQRAAEDYYVILKSPGEITLDTGITDHQGNRLFPNKGLIVPDMCRAITKNGLVTEVRHTHDFEEGEFNQYLRKLINAYSPIKIPILLGLKVPINGDYYGHAVAICAHRMNSSSSTNNKNFLQKIFKNVYESEPKINWEASKINKFYAHDDQWGPFSNIEFAPNDTLITNWTRFSEKHEPCLPVAVIIPVYPKIRISYDDIETIILGFDKILMTALEHEINGPVTWDIQIFLSEEYKSKFKTQDDILDDTDEEDKVFQFKVLTLNLPKYIWIATIRINNIIVIEFLFDATGLAQSMLGLHVINYFPTLQSQLQQFLDNNISTIKNLVKDSLNVEYINFLQKEMSSITYS